MHEKNVIIVIAVIGIILGVCILWKKEGYSPLQPLIVSTEIPETPPNPLIGPDPNISYKSGFLPSHQGPYFQGLKPSIPVENRYHANIHSMCGGDYGNYKCRQAAYLKALKNGTTDKADLICQQHQGDEQKYYECLDGVYGDYKWMDRFVGTDPCLCPGRKTGATAIDGSCHCGLERPQHDRRPLDEFNNVVTRLQ